MCTPFSALPSYTGSLAPRESAFRDTDLIPAQISRRIENGGQPSKLNVELFICFLHFTRIDKIFADIKQNSLNSDQNILTKIIFNIK